MRLFIFALAALLPLNCFADEPAKLPGDAIRAERTYTAAKDKLDKLYASERKRIDELYKDKLGSLRADLVTELQDAKVAAAKRVDLAGANAIEAAIKAVPTVHEVPGVEEPAAKATRFPKGRVKVWYGPGKGRSYVFGSKRMIYVEPNMSFRFSADGEGGIAATRSDGERDRWTPYGTGRWVVENIRVGQQEPFAVGFAIEQE